MDKRTFIKRSVAGAVAIGEIADKPLTRKEKKLLDNEFLTVKEYPFFDPKA